jgi:hypothetical protein
VVAKLSNLAVVAGGLLRAMQWTQQVCAHGGKPHTAVAQQIAAGKHPKEVAVCAAHASVSFTIDRYGHLLPGSEEAQ